MTGTLQEQLLENQRRIARLEQRLAAADTRRTVPTSVGATTDASDLTTGTLPIARIADGDITLVKLASIATARFLGRTTAGAGAPEAMTAAQATALLDLFTAALQGLVPPSGGGTTNFLRADGSWAAPGGGGGGAATQLDANGTALDVDAIAPNLDHGIRLYDGVCMLPMGVRAATTATNISGRLYVATRAA